MGAFEVLHDHFEKNMGNIGATRGIIREDGSAVAENGDITRISKDDKEEALETIADHEEDELERTLKGIRRNREDEKGQPKEKALDTLRMMLKGRKPDPDAAYKDPEKYKMRGTDPGHVTDPEDQDIARYASKVSGVTGAGETRSRMGEDWEPGMGPVPQGSAAQSKKDRIYRRLGGGQGGNAEWERIKAKAGGKEGDDEEDDDNGEDEENAVMMNMRKMSPALANLLSAAAGWALSADTASSGVPPEMAAEWERAQSREDKKKLQEEMVRKLKGIRKSDDDPFLELDHAPVPPRMGLMWDAVKHRWTRPEKVGRTVWEVQGKKRLRGSGTGVHERSRAGGGAGGKGQGSMEAGRRFRSVADAGRTHPHDAKRLGQATHPKRRKKRTAGGNK
tara:strand:- start:565 stop:1740 length:1176 start_codon:yes stop_codon:yes gene_type:complete